MPGRYRKETTAEELWRVVDTDTGRIVHVSGSPLDDLEEREADEAIDLLDAGDVTPDILEAPNR